MLEVLTEEALPEITRPELDKLRKELWQRLGGLPERCNLGLEKIEEVDLGDLVREVVRYQVEPGEWVVSYILRPKKIDKPLPGILALHEHGGKYECGKLEPADLYTDDIWNTPPSALGWGLELARRGYLLICPDQLCHESRNFKHVSGFAGGAKHEQFEALSRLAQGKTLVGKNAYDISRALDVLVSRPDVHSERIGVMGHSGGGTNSYLACMYDPRITAAVINCGISSGLNRIDLARGSGATGTVPEIIMLGDKASGAALMAPRAVLFFNGSEDWIMPIEGILNTYYRAKKAYYALGVPERLELAIAEGPHLFGPKRRQQGYDWFDRWLKETPINPSDVWYRNERPDPSPVTKKQLDMEGLKRSCGGYLKEIPEANPSSIRHIQTESSGPAKLEEVRITVERTVNFNHHTKQLDRPGVAGEYLASARSRVEPNGWIDLWIRRPDGNSKRKRPAVIILHRDEPPCENGRDEVMGLAGDESFALAPAVTQRGALAVAMDLPGYGSRQNQIYARKYKGPRSFVNTTAFSYIAAGTSILARGVHDVRCVVNYLRSRDDVDPERIDLVGFGSGGFLGLFAAMLTEGIRSVAAIGGVTTQAAAIAKLDPDRIFLYEPCLLPAGDVPAALKLLAPKRCKLICFEGDPDWPANGARAVAKAMKGAYAVAGEDHSLSVQWVTGQPNISAELQASILDWLAIS